MRVWIKPKLFVHLRHGGQQLLQRGVAVRVQLKLSAGVFAEGAAELRQEDLVIMVGVQQRTDVSGELVKSGQPHALLIVSLVSGELQSETHLSVGLHA